MEKASEAEVERLEMRSFISFLHFVLIKVIRDNNPIVRCFVPGFRGGYSLAITVERVPKGMRPADTNFVVDAKDLERASTHFTHSPTQDQIDAVMDDSYEREQ